MPIQSYVVKRDEEEAKNMKNEMHMQEQVQGEIVVLKQEMMGDMGQLVQVSD